MTKKLPPEVKQNRKPTRVACEFCHAKHLQCDDTRPCKNCRKRGVADTCKDAVRKRKSTLRKPLAKPRTPKVKAKAVSAASSTGTIRKPRKPRKKKDTTTNTTSTTTITTTTGTSSNNQQHPKYPQHFTNLHNITIVGPPPVKQRRIWTRHIDINDYFNCTGTRVYAGNGYDVEHDDYDDC
ncbi:unnamed protein product [Ambrosiozyma monospora]|uniref:Unnamed protein product n=1 Tax=Ambrosiozyma monospora TaxID=43982 RepID=A0ACB5T696_AMBMO|nr:unnamed protein product [Ambrosiozyma monospora]